MLTVTVADPEVDLFAGMKKKKKKQTVIEVEDTPEALPPVADAKPAEPAAPVEEEQQPKPSASTETAQEEKTEAAAPVDGGDAAAATEDGDFFADMKKKKKKSKKEIPLDLETATSSADPATLDGLDVPMKKKKSKKQAQDFAKELDEMDAEQEEAAAAAADEGEDGEDAGDRTTGADGVSEGQEPWVVENREATYPELLKRFFTLLHQHDPELAGEKKRYTIAPPQVAREGTKKTVFANVSDICRRMHRQPEHVIQFLYSELGTQGSVDGAQRLIMKGRYNQKQIENVLRKYINEYVTCKICKSPDTLLEKDNRLYFINCESCGSRRSVAAIKAGFQAQIGKRIKPT